MSLIPVEEALRIVLEHVLEPAQMLDTASAGWNPRRKEHMRAVTPVST